MRTAFALVCALACGAAQGQFRFRELNANSLELAENGRPVFVYNNGIMLKEGLPPDRARCCYLHPVYTPDGVVITDDFPADHLHHRGIHWTWPAVLVDGESYNPWSLKGLEVKFEKWTRREANRRQAVLGVENGWYAGGRKVVQEDVEVTVYPAAKNRQDLVFTLRFQPMVENVILMGEQDRKKGYGGFNLRFAPLTGARIQVPGAENADDSNLEPHPWAELRGEFNGQLAGARITIDPSNPGYPNGWCLRHYGFLGVDFPGLQPYKLEPRTPLIMKYRVTLLAGNRRQTRRSSK